MMQVKDQSDYIRNVVIEEFHEYERRALNNIQKGLHNDIHFSFADFASGFEACLELVRKGDLR